MCWGKIRGFLLEPGKAFRKEKKSSVEDSIKYMVVPALAFSVLAAVLVFSRQPSPVGLVVWIIIGVPLLIVAALLGGLWLHLWAYALGARRGLQQTLKVGNYAATPYFLFGWVPWIGILFLVWNLGLEVAGLRALQGLSRGRAAAAVFLSIIPFIILFAILVWLLATLGPGLLDRTLGGPRALY